MPWCKPSLTLFMIVTCVCGQDRFYFSKQPEDAIAVVAGDPVTLECEVSHNNGIAYSWQLNGALLSNTTRRHQLGPRLHITRADRVRDSGKFACIATNTSSGYSITSTAVSLNILWLGEPVLVQLQAPTNPKAGDNVTLRCGVDGSGDIHIDWYRNVHRLSKTEHISFSKKRLHMRNVSFKDNGVYRCKATNEAGSRSSADSYALAVPGNGVASIRVVPKDQLVKEGDTAHFDCVYDKAKITEWYFNESTESLQNSTRIMVYPNGTLIIKEVTSFDAGYYSCVGVHSESAEDPQRYTAELSIAYLDDLTSLSFEPPLPNDMTRVVPEQAEFELTCIPAGGRPPARVWWLDPRGRTISDTGHVRVDETRLIIEAARAVEDAGNYSCVAENLAGTKMSTFQLIISTPPSIVSGPVSMNVEEGEPASFTCHFSAMEYPVTSVLWEKDGRLVSDEGQRVMINIENGSIGISSTQLEDRGNYSCVVNTTGFNPIRSEPAVLLIKEKLKFTPRPVNKKLELGSNAKVYCKAQGVQPLMIKWIKEDQNGEQTFDLPSHVQDVNGTLQFTRVTAEDKGRYVCVATNPQGIINATIDIDVIVTPKFSVLPQNPTEAYEGFPVMIHCNAEGDPKPTIRWDRNSNFSGFDPKRFHVLENGSLLVQEVHMTDSGKYGCTAGNSGGFKREEVTLIVKSPEGYHPEDTQEEGSMMTKTFTITLSIAGSYMLLVIGLMIWCRHRRKRRKQAYLTANGAEGTDILLAKAENGEVGGEHTELKENPGSGTGEGADTVQSHSSAQSKRSNKSSNYDRLVFPRQDLHNMILLGRGEFGEVFVAKAHGVEGAGCDDKEKGGASVLVKALQNTRDDAILQEFKRQLDMFYKAQSEYVVKLVGLCREAEPHYMILEHTDWGDLKQFLLGTRAGNSSKSKPSPQLSVTQIIALATQVVKGMEHLSNLRFVHRDLAARNCMITSTLTVKVSLPALCKDTYSKEYYKHHNHLIPLRWMPYEAVFEDEHSTKSDVYSFACLIWELFYQGELPFKDMSDEEVLAALKKHELQWRPHKAAPESLQTLLTSCWADSARNRPSFSQLAVTMADICASSEI